MIVVDTSVLSLAFRRRGSTAAEPPVVTLLRRMISDDVPLGIPGIVLQELLSGVRRDGDHDRLQRLLEGFPILLAERADHIAATISSACRRHGIAASTVDCLIAAIAISREAPLLTIDRDFSRMVSYSGLRLLPLEADAR